jgi:hypothetical protein
MAKRKKSNFNRNTFMVFLVLFIVFGGSAVLLPDSWTNIKHFMTEAGATWFLGTSVFLVFSIIERLSPLNQRRPIPVRAWAA